MKFRDIIENIRELELKTPSEMTEWTEGYIVGMQTALDTVVEYLESVDVSDTSPVTYRQAHLAAIVAFCADVQSKPRPIPINLGEAV